MTARVRAMHRRVRGALAEPVGRYAAGTRYRADDPELLMWVVFSLVDSAVVVYGKYVRSISREEEAARWQDYRVIGRLFGLSDLDMPGTLDDLERYRREMLDGDRLHVSRWARNRARKIVLEPPVPLMAQPLLQTVTSSPSRCCRTASRAVWVFVAATDDRAEDARRRRRCLRQAGGLPLLPERLRLVAAARAG